MPLRVGTCVFLIVRMTTWMVTWVISDLPLLQTALTWRSVPNLCPLVWIYLQGDFLEVELLSQKIYKFKYLWISPNCQNQFLYIYMFTNYVCNCPFPHTMTRPSFRSLFIIGEGCSPVFSSITEVEHLFLHLWAFYAFPDTHCPLF